MRRVDPSVVGLGILVGLYLAATVSLLPLGADDIPMVGVFSFDEANIAGEVLRLHEHSLSTKPSFKYGGAFYYPPVMSLAVTGWFTEVSQQTLIVTVRTFCTLAGAGCLVLTFLLGRAVFGALTGLMAAFFLAATPAFLRWSVEGHPDLPQLFWVIASLLCCARIPSDPRGRWALMAGATAGLAFGTKYGDCSCFP